MIPDPYLALFRADVEDAVTLAEAGDPTLGFEILDMGLACVEAPPGEPWAGELVNLYQRAMVRLHEAPDLLRSELVSLEPVLRDSAQGQWGGRSSYENVTHRSRLVRERVMDLRRAAEQRCLEAGRLRVRARETAEAARAVRMRAQRTRERTREVLRRQ